MKKAIHLNLHSKLQDYDTKKYWTFVMIVSKHSHRQTIHSHLWLKPHRVLCVRSILFMGGLFLQYPWFRTLTTMLILDFRHFFVKLIGKLSVKLIGSHLKVISFHFSVDFLLWKVMICICSLPCVMFLCYSKLIRFLTIFFHFLTHILKYSNLHQHPILLF